MFFIKINTPHVPSMGRVKGVFRQLSAAYTTACDKSPYSAENKNFSDALRMDWTKAKPYQQLPGLTKWQLLRGFMKGGEFSKVSNMELMQICRDRYGDIFRLPGLFGRADAVVLFNLNDFEKVQRTEGVYPVRPGSDAIIHYRQKRKDKFFDDVLGLGTSGEEWASFRKAINPVLMQPKNAKLYIDPLQKVSQQFVQRIREIRDPHTLEVPNDFVDILYRFTFESVTIVALDKELGLLKASTNSNEAYEFFESTHIFLESFLDLVVQPSLYKYVPTPTYKRFEKAMDTIFNITQKYINESLIRIDQENGESRGEKSILEKLCKVNKKIAIVMAMDMILAGVDTTTTALAGLLLNIARYPEKQQKVREEILHALPRKADRFSIDNMKHLPYLRACIKESLRIYPLSSGNMRATGADLPLSGYRIPKGTMVFMNSNMLLSEEKYYPRAKEFIPERWLRNSDRHAHDEHLLASNLSPFIYAPFGFGPRTCAGKRIVDMELEIVLGNLLRNFSIEFNYSADNAFVYHFIASPAIPLKFKFIDLNC